MKFLADMGVPLSTVQALREAGHDAAHLRELGLNRLPDPAVFAKGFAEGRVVLTFDLDFSDLLAQTNQRLPSVIIFRLRDARPTSVTPRLLSVLLGAAAELEKGAVIIVKDGHYRIRLLPLFPD